MPAESQQKRKNFSSETGAVTAEFAVVLPAVIAVLALVLGTCAAGISQIQLEESARLAARAAARGENTETVQRIATEVVADADVSLVERSGTVQVVVTGPAPGVLATITDWRLTAEATVAVEEETLVEGIGPGGEEK